MRRWLLLLLILFAGPAPAAVPTATGTLDPQSIGEKDVNPMAWTREIAKGRVFYTAMGHTKESYSDAFFLRLLGQGLDWVVRRR